MLFIRIKNVILFSFFSGYVCKQIEKHFACDTCKIAIRIPKAFSQIPCAEIVNLKSRGFLIHSNINFFLLLREVEGYFSKHVSSPNVYEETVNEMLNNYKFSFPCTEHGSELLSYAITYYLRLRMRQYSQQINKDAKKNKCHKKKASKIL